MEEKECHTSSSSIEKSSASSEASLESSIPVKVKHTRKSVTKVKDVSSSSLYYRKLSWLTFGAETPILTGGTYMADGKLVLADYNNQRILLFDQQYNFLKGFKIEGWPTDVAKTSVKDEIFVLLCDKALLRYKFEDSTLRTVCQLDLPSGVSHIASFGETVVLSSLSSVNVLSVSGEIILSIPKNSGHAHVASSKNYQYFYYKDGDAIVCHSLRGNEMFRHEDQLLQKPRGLCVDRDDIVYVCAHDSGSLYQIGSDGLYGRILLSSLHKIRKPNAIMFDPVKNHLLVTSWGESTAFEVYQISS